ALAMLGLSAWPGFQALKGAPAALEGAFLTTFGKMNYGVLGASGVVPGYSQTAFNLGMAATAAVALGVLAPELAIPAGALSAAIGLYQFANGGGANNCGQFGGWARALLPSGGVGAIDPNDKTGPSGAGTGQWLPGNARMSYTVSFENEPTASAPAQEVVITDQLDPTKVNLSTLSLNPLGFGNTLLTPPSGSTDYNTVVDFGPSASVEDLLVYVQGSLDPTTGLLKWTFQSIDASTGLPPDDPEAGFLPPDSSPPGGDGFVSYSVLPKTGIAEGTQITNMASVVFDQNASINTPVWTNTVAAPLKTALKISPSKLAFPATLPGATSKPASVTVLNPNKKGDSPVLIENVMLTGNFVTQSVNNCVGTLLMPSQSCTFSVVFAPDATSPVTSGKLTITDNASGSPQKRSLSGKLMKQK
ncbi:MAG TPA: hypothetical protein VMD75_17200, partial [Candidatus Binataceae bacterium]|nr:hypothetical protein [Candidatus Binataceae bacterium]